MKKLTIVLITLSVFTFWNTKVNAQCDITASGSPLHICVGDLITLTSSGDCTNFLMDNDFNNGTYGTGWSTGPGCQFNNRSYGILKSFHSWFHLFTSRR